MYILFSPSEAKLSPSEIEKKGVVESTGILKDKLWGGQKARNANIQIYLRTLQDSNHSELCKIFGTKRINLDLLSACLTLTQNPRIEALQLYSGVAYKALDFVNLESKAQDFLRKSVLIFSNLFGLVRGSDLLPYYHLNQNYRSPNLNLGTLYNAQSKEINKLLDDECVIDLRSGVYIKAYPLKNAHYTLPIPKGTSHQAKLYRGKALRQLAIASLDGKDAIAKTLNERFIYN